MRFWLLVWAMVLAGTGAQAAPTCLDRRGNTTRCDIHGAMPVGWKPPSQTLLERELSLPPNPGVNGLLKIALGLAAIFALIALLPDFDGDWEPGGKDDDTRR